MKQQSDNYILKYQSISLWQMILNNQDFNNGTTLCYSLS
jgi:hypothetical protein